MYKKKLLKQTEWVPLRLNSQLVFMERWSKQVTLYLIVVWCLQVILRDMAVRCAGDVASLIPRVEELDVSKTLISSWEEISEITSQLQLLTSLNVSDNRLQIPKVGIC